MTEITFSFYGVEFSFKPIVPIIGGFFIAGLASFLGIGGGFLFVPFLTSIAGLPMFLVAGTSALTVLVGMIISIITYMGIKGVPVYWPLIGVELIGIFVGSMIGPAPPSTSPTSGSSVFSSCWPSMSACATRPRVFWATASFRRSDAVCTAPSPLRRGATAPFLFFRQP
jgi:hypothetical protein